MFLIPHSSNSCCLFITCHVANDLRFCFTHISATVFEVPDTWVAPLDIYSEHLVDPASAEFKQVEKNFLSTIQHEEYFPNGINKIVQVCNLPLFRLKAMPTWFLLESLVLDVSTVSANIIYR